MIATQFEVRRALRAWVLEHTDAPDDGLFDDTPLWGCRYLTPEQVPELVLYIQGLREEEVDMGSLVLEAFRDIDQIVETFFSPAAGPALTTS